MEGDAVENHRFSNSVINRTSENTMSQTPLEVYPRNLVSTYEIHDMSKVEIVS